MRRPIVLWVAVLGLIGCSTAGAGAPPITPQAEYSAASARLFDDVLAAHLFGFDPQARVPENDPLLPERIVQADVVFPGRVETLSRVGGVDGLGAFEIVVRAAGPALVGSPVPETETLVVSANGPSYAWLAGAGASWVGTRLLLFCKRFRSGRGAVLHFHAEPDTEALRAAVDRHAGLRVLRQ